LVVVSKWNKRAGSQLTFEACFSFTPVMDINWVMVAFCEVFDDILTVAPAAASF
jgi:hypothetical protein